MSKEAFASVVSSLFLAGVVAACSGALPTSFTIPPDGGPTKTGDAGDGSDASDGNVSPGDGAPATLELSPTSIDFGRVDCGEAAPNETLRLANTGGSPLSWSVAIAPSDGFEVDGKSSGSVPPGGEVRIAVSAIKIPAMTAAGAVVSGTLTLKTSDATHASSLVPLTLTAQGATLGVLPLTAAFGDVPLDVQAPDIPVTLTNTGNQTALVTFDAPAISDFTVTWAAAPAALSIAPGGTAAATARFRPTSSTANTTSAALHVTGAGLCGASASTLPMTGQGVTGIVALSPGELDFGPIDCGSQAAAQSLTLYNTGDAPFTWTSALGKGSASPYVLSPPGGTVPASSKVTVSVVPSPIPASSSVTADFYADSLVLTTDALGDAPHTVALHESAQGAILSFGVAGLPFGAGAVGATTSLPLSLTNSGNASATVTLSTSGAPFAASPAAATAIGASGNLPVTASFVPTAPLTLGPVAGTLVVSATGALCAALPTTVALTATATDTPTQISAFGIQTCAIGKSGGTYCWGDDTFGELGNGNYDESDYATSVTSLSGATQISDGDDFTCALVSGGAVKCWGDSTYGELGNGSYNGSPTPVSVALSGATLLRSGWSHACAVLSGGTIDCWGSNDSGQLGNGSYDDSPVPVAVSSLTGVTALGLGQEHSCAVSAGLVYCWGDNSYGELANAKVQSSTTPLLVAGLSGVTAVTAGDYATCALLATGTVECWGDNSYGELGNASYDSSTTPVAVSGLTGVTAIDTSGGSHVCALLSTGTAVCWGSGTSGQLGNGGSSDSDVPVPVTGVSGATAIATGSGRGCVLAGTGILCWGIDQSGDLGQGIDGETSLTAAAVVGL